MKNIEEGKTTEINDKCGTKGVISEIIKDSEMPTTDEEKPEMVIPSRIRRGASHAEPF